MLAHLRIAKTWDTAVVEGIKYCCCTKCSLSFACIPLLRRIRTKLLNQTPGAGWDADMAVGGRREGMEPGTGAEQGPVAIRTSFKTAIVNRKSAMLLLSQVM